MSTWTTRRPRLTWVSEGNDFRRLRVMLKAGEVFEIAIFAHDTPPSIRDTACCRAALLSHIAGGASFGSPFCDDEGTSRTKARALQLLLPGRRLTLLLLLQLLLPGMAAAVDAAGDGAEDAVVAGIVTGDAADRRALQAALGIGGG